MAESIEKQQSMSLEENQKILEKTISILNQEKGNQQKTIEELKTLLDLKLTDPQRKVNDQNFLLDLKMFRTRKEFTKFMEQVRDKIDIQIKDYYTLQSLYELQKAELKHISTKIGESDRVNTVLNENKVYVDIEVYIARCKDIEYQNQQLKEENQQLQTQIRDHKQVIEQLKDINSREKQLFKLQIQGLEEDKNTLKTQNTQILKEILRLQQTTTHEASDEVMKDILQNNEKEIKEVINEQQEKERKEEEEQMEKQMKEINKQKEQERQRKELEQAVKQGKQPTQKAAQQQHKVAKKIHRQVNKSVNKSVDKSIEQLPDSNGKYQNIDGFSETAKLITKNNSSSNIKMVKDTKYLNKSMSKRSGQSHNGSRDNSMSKDRSIIIKHDVQVVPPLSNGQPLSPVNRNQSTIIKELLKEQPNNNEFLTYSQIVNNDNKQSPIKQQQQSSNHKSFKGLSSFKYDYSKKKHQAKKQTQQQQ